jgi:hypothetical protein
MSDRHPELEPILKLQGEWVKNGGDPQHGPLSRYFGKQTLNELQKVFEELKDGEQENRETTINFQSSFFLLKAIDVCARTRLPMPDWLASAFRDAFQQLTDFKTDSIDKAFGKPIRKRRHLNSIKKEEKLKFQIYRAVIEAKINKECIAIDRELFESIGMATNPQISGGEAERIWRLAVTQFGRPSFEYFKNPPF